MIVYLVIYFAVEPNSLPRLGVAVFIVTATLLTLLWRLVYIRTFTSRFRQQRVLIVGAGKASTALVEVIYELDPPPFKLIGLIDDDPAKLGTNIHGSPILGNHESMTEIIANQGITDLILAISNEMNHGMFQSILTAQEEGVNLYTMTELTRTSRDVCRSTCWNRIGLCGLSLTVPPPAVLHFKAPDGPGVGAAG